MTADEIKLLIDAADNSRDRCMMSLQYECALRPVDLGRLRWGDITQTGDGGSSIAVQNKTKFERTISVYLFNGYLNQWRRDSPNAGDENGFVFVNIGAPNKGKQMKLDNYGKMVNKYVKSADINGRKASPHTLRHSRITFWLQNNVSIAKICLMAWGTEYSPMIKVYAHLANDDMAREQRRLAGVAESKIQVGSIELETCPTCGFKNSPGSGDYCGKCGSPLDEEAAKKLRQMQESKTLDIINDQQKEIEALKATLGIVLKKLETSKLL
jgi:integrase